MIKGLFKDTVLYGFGSVFYSVVQFISIPLIISSLNKSEVGDWNIFLSTNVILVAFLICGTDSAVIRFYHDEQDSLLRKKLFSTGIYFEIGISIFLMLLLLIFSHFLKKQLSVSTILSSPLQFSLLTIPLFVANQYLLNWLKYTFELSKYLLVTIVSATCYLFFIIFLHFQHKVTLENIMIVILFSQSIAFILGILLLRANFIFSFDNALVRNLLKYGLPFMLMTVGLNFIFSIDRFILKGQISSEKFALYTISQKIVVIPSMLITAFTIALSPYILARMKESGAGKILARVHLFYLMSMIFISIPFLCFSKILIVFLAGKSYLGAEMVLPFLILGFIYYGTFTFTQSGIIFSKKTAYLVPILFASLTLVILSDLLLVKKFEQYGTAFGFLLGMIALVVGSNLISKKHFDIPFYYCKSIILIIVFIFNSIAVLFYTIKGDLLIDGILKLIILFPVNSLFLYFILPKTDRDNFKIKLVYLVKSKIFSLKY